ncbi:MAG: MBL fold metallo-hydrolase, partial [Geminicoccaceae bacterium]
AAAGESQKSGRPYHHTFNGFRNPPGSPTSDGDFGDWAGFFWRGATRNRDVAVPPDHALSHEAVLAGLKDGHGADRITWLGHASFLISLGGRAIVTDPFLSDYSSPIPPLGPKRVVPPALRADELPPIDLLLLTHNHYDHLDLLSLDALPRAPGVRAIVPLGLSDYPKSRGFDQVTEMDWHDKLNLDGLEITSLPAIHMSKRGLFDRNRTLWTSYSLETEKRRLYIAGDTAYGPVFQDLANKLPPFDVGLVPIGAYEPRHLMREVHASPEEAVKIGQDLAIKRLVAKHWGTIQLTDEPLFEPTGRFRTAARDAGYPDVDIWTMKIGETRLL